MDDPLLRLGATEQPFPVPLERVDNPQVFLGTRHQAQSKKEGETKPLLLPDFISPANFDGSIEDEQDIGGSAGAQIVLRASRSKPKLENISLSMWVAANARIMHKLSNTGKLSGSSQIADYLSYTVKVAELLKCHTLASYRHVPIYPSNYTATGLAWQFHGDNSLTYLYDCRLPFGAAKSPEIFHRLTQAITRMMERWGFTVLAYLDDFLIIADTKAAW